MPSGKMASQASHASRLSLLHFLKQNPHRLDEFIDKNLAGSVIVLKVDNEQILHTVFEKAKEEDFPSALFTDSGHILEPHFNGEPIVTALSIGPALKQDMYHLTKKFKLVK